MILLFHHGGNWDRNKAAFTFQYVSIISPPKSEIRQKAFFIYIPICFYYFLVAKHILNRARNLHSNMFLLFQSHQIQLAQSCQDLHSNMFLLFHIAQEIKDIKVNHLHSNMFLLFQRRSFITSFRDFNLHSNMFLLFRSFSVYVFPLLR